MSRNRFAATRITPAQAHELWVRSDEASAFTRPDYLAQLVDEVEWWGVERAGEVVAAWPLVRAEAGGEIGPPPFCYYVGPMFSNRLRRNKYHRYWSDYTTIFSELIEAMSAAHPRFRFSLPLGFDDVRVMQWWNFDHPEHAGFTITPRYTARIDLSALPDRTALYGSFARTRKRALAPWQTEPPDLADTVSTKRLLELHDETLRRSGGNIDPTRHQALQRLIDLAESGAGEVIGVVPPRATQVEAAIIVLDGRDESNWVFSAASYVWRDAGLTPWMLWLALLRARRMDKRWFDFNGANSPRRAADKHYYSAEAKLYFDCIFG